ncbi:MAG: selenocysteine-specific translation elongation factor [Eubacteriales bacterium]
MKNLIMGTAGHIDHGKTSLVKRISGIDTDKLVEEKKRGMTIELGFAPLYLPSGACISIIDVPGHEKFIKTMVSGVTAIDITMLVIDAEEGVMPQTLEHIQILSLLGVNAGFVALTKIDKVDSFRLGEVEDQIKATLVGTTLEGINIIPVSSLTGENIDSIINELENLAYKIPDKEERDFLRITIDRVFVKVGFGNVVTGTVISGMVKIGDQISILPINEIGKVRGIQVHNKNVEIATSSNRCAVNISGMFKKQIEKGNVISHKGILESVSLLDVKIKVLETEITHNQRVFVLVGTKQVIARIRLIGVEKMARNTTAYAQLKLEEPIVAIRGDKFIIRSYSPINVIGGGEVIYHMAKPLKRFDDLTLEYFKNGESQNIEVLIKNILDISATPLLLDEIWKHLYLSKLKIEELLEEGVANGSIFKLKDSKKYISKKSIQRLMFLIGNEFEELQETYPFRFQISKEEIKNKLFKNIDSKDYNQVLNIIIGENKITVADKNLQMMDSSLIDKIKVKKETIQVENYILENGFNTSNIAQIKELFNKGNKSLINIDEVLRFLISQNIIIDFEDGLYMHYSSFYKGAEAVREIINSEGLVSASSLRDFIQTGRKSAILILEYLDKIGVTIREENYRKPGVHFMDFYK